MTENQKTLAKYKALLVSKEQALISQSDDIRNFVATEHSAKDTEKAQQTVRQAEKEIEAILQSLLNDDYMSPELAAASETLRQQFRDLKLYSRGMLRDLSDDLTKQQRIEDKQKVDFVRNVGVFFGIVGAFIGAAKAGVGDGKVSVDQAAEAGGIVGVLTLSHKNIKKAFVAVGAAVCKTPQQIQGSFTLFYVKETIKSTAVEAKRAFEDGQRIVTVRMVRTASRAKASLAKRWGNQKPKQ